MQMTIGQKISQSRKEKGLRLSDLAEAIDMSISGVRKIETDGLQGGPSPDTLIKIADALGDPSILIYALLHNPICQRIIPRAFTPLNNINGNPSAILASLKMEMQEGIDAIEIMEGYFCLKDPSARPEFRDMLFAKLEQIIDVPRGVEELMDHLKLEGFLTEADQLEVYIRQQAKVEAHGHHKPGMEG